MDHTGCDNEYVTVEINFHCSPSKKEGVHLSITIDGIAFSLELDDCIHVYEAAAYINKNTTTRFIIKDVPIEVAKNAAVWITSLCRNEADAAKVNASKSINSAFSEWIGGKKNPNGEEQHYYIDVRPCAWLVQEMISQMGFLQEFENCIGSFKSTELITTPKRDEKDYSHYYRAYESLERWGYPLSTMSWSMSYNTLIHGEKR